jgi:hypothetical protein
MHDVFKGIVVGFIIILPIAGWLKRRRNKGGGGSSP